MLALNRDECYFEQLLFAIFLFTTKNNLKKISLQKSEQVWNIETTYGEIEILSTGKTILVFWRAASFPASFGLVRV